MLGLSYLFQIIPLRKWYDNISKNQTLLEMIQSLQTNNEQLVEKINTLERDAINLTHKIQSMSKGTEKLSKRIHTVEFDNQNLLKSYDRFLGLSDVPVAVTKDLGTMSLYHHAQLMTI